MSMTSCHICSTWIDTDETPECYYLYPDDDKAMDYPLCENCKEDVLRDKEECQRL